MGRDKVSMDSQLGQYGTDAEKSAFTSKLETMENWLYDEGFDATKSVYFEKLSELKKLGGPLQMRQIEAQGRPNAMKALQMNMGKYKNWALQEAQLNPIYSHITDEERQKVVTKCDEASSWMYEMLDKQGSLPLNVDPVVTVSQIQANNSEVTNVCSPIRYKKAPPPPKKEAPKENESGKSQVRPILQRLMVRHQWMASKLIKVPLLHKMHRRKWKRIKGICTLCLKFSRILLFSKFFRMRIYVL